MQLIRKSTNKRRVVHISCLEWPGIMILNLKTDTSVNHYKNIYKDFKSFNSFTQELLFFFHLEITLEIIIEKIKLFCWNLF